MSARVQRHVASRLSLRPPQAESLARLKRSLDAAPAMLERGERDVPAMLETLKAEFPTVPSLRPSPGRRERKGIGTADLFGDGEEQA